MDKRQIIDTNFDTAKADMKTTDFIDNDIALYDDASKIQLPKEPRRTTFIFVGLCTAGTASYTIDTEDVVVRKNDIVIISERRVTENYTASPDFECIGMFMSMNFYYETIRNVSDISAMLIFSRTTPEVSVSEKEARMFTDYFRILQSKTADTANPFRRKVVQALVLAMFYDLNAIIHHMETRGRSKRPRADIIFTEFIRLVEANFKSERRVSWYAEQMCITPKYLAETVKQVSRRTPNEWIDNYVTLELRLKLKTRRRASRRLPPTCTSPTSRSWASTSRSTSGSRPRRTGKSNRATGETERQARPARKNHDTTPHAPPRRRRSNAKRGIRHNQTARLAMPDAQFCIMKRPSEPTLWATAAWRGRGFGAAR